MEFPQIKTVEAKNGGLYKKDWHQNLILFIFRLAPIVSGCCGMSLVTVVQSSNSKSLQLFCHCLQTDNLSKTDISEPVEISDIRIVLK